MLSFRLNEKQNYETDVMSKSRFVEFVLSEIDKVGIGDKGMDSCRLRDSDTDGPPWLCRQLEITPCLVTRLWPRAFATFQRRRHTMAH